MIERVVQTFVATINQLGFSTVRRKTVNDHHNKWQKGGIDNFNVRDGIVVQITFSLYRASK